jgi:hypothetical protein
LLAGFHFLQEISYVFGHFHCCSNDFCNEFAVLPYAWSNLYDFLIPSLGTALSLIQMYCIDAITYDLDFNIYCSLLALPEFRKPTELTQISVSSSLLREYFL